MKKVYIYSYFQYKAGLELYAFETKQDAINYALDRISTLLRYEESKYLDTQERPKDIIDVRAAITSNNIEKTLSLWDSYIGGVTGHIPIINKIEEKEIFTDSIKLNSLTNNINADFGVWQPAIQVQAQEEAPRPPRRAARPLINPLDIQLVDIPPPAMQAEVFDEEEDGDGDFEAVV